MKAREKSLDKGVYRAAVDVLVIVGITAAVLIFLEVVLRVTSGESNDVYRHHPVYGMEIGAAVRSKYERPSWHGGETIWWQTNSQGFRGEELAENPDKRIVVYGDSNVFAMFSELPNTFTEKLAGSLNEAFGSEVEVVNAGTVGYGPDQNLLRSQHEAPSLQPDLIIFYIFADNDFGDLIRNRRFDIVDSQLVRREHPLVEDSYLNSEPSLHLTRMVLRWRRDLVQYLLGNNDGPIIPRDQRGMSPEERSSAVVTALLERSRREFEHYQTGAARKFSYLSDEYDIDIALQPDSLASRTKAALMEGVLSSVSAFSLENRIPLMVLIQPSVSDLTSLRPVHAAHLKSYSGYDPRRLTALVEDICIRHGIPVLNLYDVFAENDPDQLFFSLDVHWNDAGQDLAAKVTADYVQANFLSEHP